MAPEALLRSRACCLAECRTCDRADGGKTRSVNAGLKVCIFIERLVMKNKMMAIYTVPDMQINLISYK